MKTEVLDLKRGVLDLARENIFNRKVKESEVHTEDRQEMKRVSLQARSRKDTVDLRTGQMLDVKWKVCKKILASFCFTPRTTIGLGEVR